MTYIKRLLNSLFDAKARRPRYDDVLRWARTEYKSEYEAREVARRLTSKYR